MFELKKSREELSIVTLKDGAIFKEKMTGGLKNDKDSTKKYRRVNSHDTEE